MSKRAMSLVELSISALVMLMAVAGIAAFVQRAGGIAAGERGGIDLQQNRRGAEREINRSLVLAGRGGLPAGRSLPRPAPPSPPPFRLPDGIAIRVENDVDDDRRIIDDPDAPRVAEGSDILTVRGVTGDLYRVGKNSLSRDADDAVTGRLVVPRTAQQDLAELEAAIAADEPVAIVIGSAADIDNYGVAELVAEDSVVASGQIELAFVFYEPGHADSEEDRPAKTYSELGPAGLFPLELFRQGAATVGILRELRYYLRHFPADETPRGDVPGDRLARAEVFPGLDRPAGDDPENLALDIAFGIADFQIALGFDTPAGGSSAGGGPLLETEDGKNDDWLWNAPDEDALGAPWDGLSPWQLKAVEVWMLARSPWPDRNHLADRIDHVGDRPGDIFNTDEARRYRRALTRWRVQPRNL
jgi:hypothetical protein